MARNTIVPDRRRQHFPPVTGRHLDEHTTHVGLEGIEAARRELHRHPGPGPAAKSAH